MKNIFSVGQINRYVKNMFTQDFILQKIYVKGEVSNCKYHTSGHIYFSLKDETGVLSCVMFAGHRRGLAFRMKDGDRVVVGGAVDVYERDGRYQLYAKEISLEGAGALYERFLALKTELEEMGMFAQEYKQPIPAFIHRLGVVTAPTGAAVQDIRNISLRRDPYLQIILYPALVQGEGAADSIVRGIHMLDQAEVDVIIVGRGGGSIEDLWAFNDNRQRLADLDELLRRAMKNRIAEERHMLGIYLERYRGLSPLYKLNQGYSFVSDREGNGIISTKQVHSGDLLEISVTDGVIEAEVRSSRKEDWNK